MCFILSWVLSTLGHAECIAPERLAEQLRARDTEPAAKLSKAGIFKTLNPLTICPDYVAYSVIAPLWSDGAEKARWLALPTGAKTGFSETQNWAFPVGTVAVKHFELNAGTRKATPVETRFLVKVEKHAWKGFSYRWNDDQTEAILVGDAGDSKEYEFGGDKRIWMFPARNDCFQCHSPITAGLAGVRTEQLNFRNQLRNWDEMGMFTNRIGDPALYPALVDPADSRQSLNSRARSYLAANCSNCHRSGGLTPTAIDLRYGLGLTEMQILDQLPMAGDLDIPGGLIVKSGNKEKSVLWQRMRRRGDKQMPPIGSTVADPDGTELIGQWIDSLTPR